jgi:hypothetical protein
MYGNRKQIKRKLLKKQKTKLVWGGVEGVGKKVTKPK